MLFGCLLWLYNLVNNGLKGCHRVLLLFYYWADSDYWLICRGWGVGEFTIAVSIRPAARHFFSVANCNFLIVTEY